MLAWLCMVAGTLFSACTSAAASAEDAQEAFEAPPAVVKTITLQEAAVSQRQVGTATILQPGELVELDAEIRTTKIAIEFSALQFERFQNTPTLPRLTVENSERQLKTDRSQLDRLKARLAHTWGDKAPMIEDTRRGEIVEALAAGTKALARFEFPGGLNGEPRDVELTALSGRTPAEIETMWPAPSGNQAMPGISYFALISQSAGLRPGDRATVSANTNAQKGVVIPNASIIVAESTSWAYVETKPGEYARKPVSLTTPVSSGYLVKDGFEPGMKVVVSGASSLLAREADPSAGGDDDDDGPAQPATKRPKDKAPPVATKDDDDEPPPVKASAAAESRPDITTGATPVDRN